MRPQTPAFSSLQKQLAQKLHHPLHQLIVKPQKLKQRRHKKYTS